MTNFNQYTIQAPGPPRFTFIFNSVQARSWTS